MIMKKSVSHTLVIGCVMRNVHNISHKAEKAVKIAAHGHTLVKIRWAIASFVKTMH